MPKFRLKKRRKKVFVSIKFILQIDRKKGQNQKQFGILVFAKGIRPLAMREGGKKSLSFSEFLVL